MTVTSQPVVISHKLTGFDGRHHEKPGQQQHQRPSRRASLSHPWNDALHPVGPAEYPIYSPEGGTQLQECRALVYSLHGAHLAIVISSSTPSSSSSSSSPSPYSTSITERSVLVAARNATAIYSANLFNLFFWFVFVQGGAFRSPFTTRTPVVFFFSHRFTLDPSVT